MFNLETQSQLVDATAAMMRSCMTATTKTWAASACHGLSLWAEMLGGGPGVARPVGGGRGRQPSRWG